ncbi:MAG: hypothetical protein DI585_01640 [Pseudomonas fluorescens]|nr:MAG: hypothetical protein DI585_01640 [Pseudomonas fluorescens]
MLLMGVLRVLRNDICDAVEWNLVDIFSMAWALWQCGYILCGEVVCQWWKRYRKLPLGAGFAGQIGG